MTRSEAAKMLAWLRSMFPLSVIPTETILAFEAELEHVDANELMTAARCHVASSKFFPTMSELLELVASERLKLPSSGEAWAEVTREIRRVGRDGGWSFSNSIIDEVVDQVGKLELCNSTNISVERAHFLKLYDAKSASLLERERQAPLRALMSAPPRHQLRPRDDRDGPKAATGRDNAARSTRTAIADAFRLSAGRASPTSPGDGPETASASPAPKPSPT